MSDEVAQGTTNARTGSTVIATTRPPPLYFFRPETGEIYECPPESAKTILAEIGLLDRLSAELSIARAKIGEILDQLERAIFGPQRDELLQQLKSADKDEAAKREKLYQELKELRGSNKSGAELFELLPLHTPKAGPIGLVGKKFTYVRSSKVKSHFRAYKLSSADKPKMESFLDKGKLDQKKLKESFSKVSIKGPVGQLSGEIWAKEFVPEFVKAFNEAASESGTATEASQASDDAKQIDFSSGATLLRFFSVADYSVGSNVTAKSFAEALKGRGEIKGAYKGRADVAVHLASGEAKWNFYFPHKKGIELYCPIPVAERKGSTTQLTQLTLGHFRLVLGANCKSLVGASLLCEGGIEFVVGPSDNGKDKRQSIKGTPVSRDPRAMARPTMDITSVATAKNAAGIELSAFAGAQAEAQIKGAFEWQRPESREFRPFAEITPSVTPQAGVGAAAAFHIKYVDGKFRIFVQLGACAGIGAKGGIEATVGVAHIAEFALWFKHQVKNAADKNIKYFEDKAFESFCAMYTLSMIEGKSLGNYLGRSLDGLRNDLFSLIDTKGKDIVSALTRADNELHGALAQIKGYLVAALDNIGQRSLYLGYQIGVCIRKIVLSAATPAEFDHICQSTNLEFAPSRNKTEGRKIIAFLIGGEDELAALELQYKIDPTPGYQLASADSMSYQLASGKHCLWDHDKAWIHG